MIQAYLKFNICQHMFQKTQDFFLKVMKYLAVNKRYVLMIGIKMCIHKI